MAPAIAVWQEADAFLLQESRLKGPPSKRASGKDAQLDTTSPASHTIVASQTHLEDALPSTSGPQLFWWDEVPTVLQYNKYIRSGYRAGLSRRQCLCSIAQLHNETGNIHVHLLPVLLLIFMLLTGALQPWTKARLAFWESIIPSVLCLLGSVCYHTMMANHWHYHRYLLIDLVHPLKYSAAVLVLRQINTAVLDEEISIGAGKVFYWDQIFASLFAERRPVSAVLFCFHQTSAYVCGVFLVLVCGAGAGIYWGLQCYPKLCKLFLTAYFATAGGCVIAGLKARTQLGRAVPMLGLLGVRGGALAARFILNTGSREAAKYFLAMEAVGMAGAMINMLRIPEKWLFKNRSPDPKCRKASFFDYFLNSHQLMHILVLFAMLFKYLGTDADYRFRHQQGNSC